MNGKLFGVGVGPGDPELITVKAVRAINAADIIFTASSTKNPYSLALEIAGPHIREDATIQKLGFPMTKDEAEAEAAWTANAETIAAALRQGKNAAFLTLGDPTTYSTFGYILKKMARVMPDARIETIPGITSFHAAAARLNRILVEGEASLLITSGAFGGELIRRNPSIENLAIVKAYKHIDDLNSALKASGHYAKAVAVTKCGRANEEIIEDLGSLETRQPDYWTLVIASK